jgi:hypothetical protein
MQSSPTIAKFEWSTPQIRLHEWLLLKAPPLGKLYNGALIVISDPFFPGRTRFVAHAVREIGNRLPDYVLGPVVRRKDYMAQLGGLAQDWERLGLPTDGSIPTQVDGQTGTTSPDAVVIPREIFSKISSLLGEHNENREKHEERALRLFKGLAPEAPEMHEAMRLVAREWMATRKWFQEYAHDPGPRMDEREPRAEELDRHFKSFENTLIALLQEFFTTKRELDDILQETNRRSD